MKSHLPNATFVDRHFFLVHVARMKPIAHILMAMMLLTCNKLHGEIYGVVSSSHLRLTVSSMRCLDDAMQPTKTPNAGLHFSWEAISKCSKSNDALMSCPKEKPGCFHCSWNNSLQKRESYQVYSL